MLSLHQGDEGPSNNKVKQAAQHPAHQKMHILSSRTDQMRNHFEGTVVLRVNASLLGLQQLTCLLFAMFCLDCLCASVADTPKKNLTSSSGQQHPGSYLAFISVSLTISSDSSQSSKRAFKLL